MLYELNISSLFFTERVFFFYLHCVSDGNQSQTELGMFMCIYSPGGNDVVSQDLRAFGSSDIIP